ncbi:hypothetical protein JCM16303_003780 [Sporobolomyces ruberrimus]
MDGPRSNSFHELKLDPTLIPPPSNLSARSNPFQPSDLSLLGALVNDTSPFPLPLDVPNDSGVSAAPTVDYAAVEQEKRKKLLAKKAALRARNQRQAQNLESELENLFASSLPDVVTPAVTTSRSAPSHGPAAKRSRHAHSPAEPLLSLRGPLEHSDETTEQPTPGSFAYNPSFARTSHASHRRPVASDLEHLPSQRLSETALSRQRVVGGFGGFLNNGEPGMEETLVIDISDSEEESDVVRTVPAVAGLPDNVGSQEDTSSTPPKAPSTQAAQGPSMTTGAQVGEVPRNRQLEEKELEIKRIMERIRDMEERKERALWAQAEEAALVAGREDGTRQLATLDSEIATPQEPTGARTVRSFSHTPLSDVGS